MSALPEATGGGTHFSHAVDLFSRRGGRAARFARGVVLGVAAVETTTQLAKWARAKTVYTVSVPSSDDVYVDLHRWLLDELPSRRRRALSARTTRPDVRGQPTLDDSTSRGKATVPLHLFYDGTVQQTVTIDGHRVKVKVEDDRDDSRSRHMSLDEMIRDHSRPEKLIFRCPTENARDAVLGFIQTVAEARAERPAIRFFVADKWGGWNRRNDLTARSLDTVILRAGQQESIVADLTRFLDDEPEYVRLGLPWHRSYLFEGPPGTGKTSLARALAERFEMDVHYIALSDMKEDTNLLNLLSGIGPRSMLVLEDLDVVHSAKSRDDAESPDRVSLSGLLNALDGFATPHGLVTVMTTNHVGVLDDALVRPGRTDRIEHLGYIDDEQLARLMDLCAPLPYRHQVIPGIVGEAQVTCADVIEAAKPHLGGDHLDIEEAMVARIAQLRCMNGKAAVT